MLAREIAAAELVSRQFQRVLGPAWWIIEPTLMALVYYFLTQQILTVGKGSGSPFLFILASTVVWRFFSRCLDQSVLAYVHHSSIMKVVSFPLMSLDLSILFAELTFLTIGFAILVVASFTMGAPITLAYLSVVPLVACLAVFTLALMVTLSCLGVFLRDIGPIVQLGLSALFFLSPSLYDIHDVPEKYQIYVYYNPFYFFFSSVRRIFIEGQFPNGKLFLLWSVVSGILIFLSFHFYKRVNKNFLRIL